MANIDAPRGFTPLRHVDGRTYNGSNQAFLIPSTDGTAVYVGDAVKIAGAAGTAGQVVAGLNVEGMATIARCASGSAEQLMVGVVVGFLPDPTNLALTYRVASTARVALVCTDASVIYEVQGDETTTPVVAASIGLNAPFSTTAGSTVTGRSGMELISASVATTNTLPLKVVGLVQRVGNAFNTGGADTDNAKFEVLLNTGVYMPNIAGG